MSCRPLFHHYEGQYQAQNAYIELDKNDNLTYDWDGTIGNGVSIDIFNGLTLSWRMPNDLTQSEIDDLIERIKPHIEIIIKNSEIGFKNGCNQTRLLNAHARKAVDDIDQICHFAVTEFCEPCNDEDCKYCMEYR